MTAARSSRIVRRAAPWLALALLSSPVAAATGVTATAAFPSPLFVGDAGRATVAVTNVSTNDESFGDVIVESLRLTTACGVDQLPCPLGQRDPNVFQLAFTASGVSMGADDMACVGRTFGIDLIDPETGTVNFTPNDGFPIVLGPPGSPVEACRIQFDFEVFSYPMTDFAPAQCGRTVLQLTEVRGRSVVTDRTSLASGAALTVVFDDSEPCASPTPLPTSSPTPSMTPRVLGCPGDCDGDGSATAADLTKMVSIEGRCACPVGGDANGCDGSFGSPADRACLNGDLDFDGCITADEIEEVSINVALFANGCPPATATPTLTATAPPPTTATRSQTPTPTRTPTIGSTVTPTVTATPSATAGVTPQIELADGALEDLVPCHGVGDRWDFELADAQELEVVVQTVDPETAADLCFLAECGEAFAGDDEIECDSAPPSFGCPQGNAIVPGPVVCRVTVSTCSPACADLDRAEYSLTILADGEPVTVLLAADDMPVPGPTPAKLAPTPTATPQAQDGLNLQVFRSRSGPAYVVVSLASTRDAFGAQITSFVAAEGDSLVTALNEVEVGGDRVLTSVALLDTGEAIPLARIRRTALLTSLPASRIVQEGDTLFDGQFFADADSGQGLLVLPGGVRRVSTAMLFEGTEPSGNGNDFVPPAATTLVTRKLQGSVKTGPTIVFPNPTASCIGGERNGLPCASNEDCRESPLDPAKCGQSSRGAFCGNGTACDPSDVNPTCGTAPCNVGGELDGQTYTIDDRINSRVGNEAAQGERVDGFFLRPNSDMVVFVIDADPELDLHVAASGFLVKGSCEGNEIQGECLTDGECEPCTMPPCRCTDGLVARLTQRAVGEDLRVPARTPPPVTGLPREIAVVVGQLVSFSLTDSPCIGRGALRFSPALAGRELIPVGDLSRNGDLTAPDVTRVQAAAASPSQTQEEIAIADINRDGAITPADAARLNFAVQTSCVPSYVFLWRPSAADVGLNRIEFDGVGGRLGEVAITVLPPS